jgi:hypothetical protein
MTLVLRLITAHNAEETRRSFRFLGVSSSMS